MASGVAALHDAPKQGSCQNTSGDCNAGNRDDGKQALTLGGEHRDDISTETGDTGQAVDSKPGSAHKYIPETAQRRFWDLRRRRCAVGGGQAASSLLRHSTSTSLPDCVAAEMIRPISASLCPG